MGKFFEQKFNLRFFEMNKYGFASPTTVLTLLEETAAEHCYNIGYGLYDLETQNIGWVLLSGTIEMIRYPRYKEDITIQTWISKYGLVKGCRENIILDNTGEIIGRAKGMWVFYDIKKRKPIEIFGEIKEKWGIETEKTTGINTDTIYPVQNDMPAKEFDIYRSDIDSNSHVNNIRYFHWLIESLPDETVENYYLKRIDAKFFSAAKFGEKVHVYVKEERKNNVFVHTMKSNVDNTLFAAAHTKWEKDKGHL